MLGLRCRLARGLEARPCDWLLPWTAGVVFVGTLDGVLGAIRCLLLEEGGGEANGVSRVGEATLRRALFAF